MAQEIKYSIHRSPLKDADGNDTYQIRQEVGSVLNEKWMTSHLKEHNNLMAKYIEQALLVIEDEIVCNLLSNNRLHIEGLGTFFLKLGFREQTDEEGNSVKPHITDPSSITSDDICIEGVGFTPDKQFTSRFTSARGMHFTNVEALGYSKHSNTYTEEEVRTRLSAYLDRHELITRKHFMGLFGFKGYTADKWLERLTTGPASMLVRNRIGTSAVFRRRPTT